MKTATVDLGDKAYDIHIGSEWSALLDAMLAPLETSSQNKKRTLGSSLHDRKALLITDEHVHTHYYQTVAAALTQVGIEIHPVVVPPGEASKSLSAVEDLYTHALRASLDRQSWIIALGGGVVGDLAGFIAATYMRGISFLQIPTSLLAQVDSSVGGKVAVNHPQAKNIIGAFHQPRCVLINTNTLKTLPRRELSTGMAELIKHGFIYDESFLNWLETHIPAIMQLDSDTLNEAVYRSCCIKAAVVSKDEKEQGLRAILNFGHTIGHGIESVAGYGRYTHGEAVALGMVSESFLALQRGLVSREYIDRIKQILGRAGLPVRMPSLDSRQMLEAMGHDKKNTGDRIAFVLPDGPGHVSLYRDIDHTQIIQALEMAGE